MWPLSGSMLRVVRLVILALPRRTLSSAPLAGSVAPLRGARIVSLAGPLGRGPSVSEVGEAPASLSPPPQPARPAASSRAAASAATRDPRLSMSGSRSSLLDGLLEAGAGRGSPTELGVDREVAGAQAQQLQPYRVARGRPRGRLGLADRLLVAVGGEEGEVELVAAGAAGVGVGLQGAAAGQGDGVDGRLAWSLGDLHPLRR